MKSNAQLNRRAKLVEAAQAAGDRVIEAAQAWEAALDVTGETTARLVATVRDLNARVAKAEKANR